MECKWLHKLLWKISELRAHKHGARKSLNDLGVSMENRLQEFDLKLDTALYVSFDSSLIYAELSWGWTNSGCQSLQ